MEIQLTGKKAVVTGSTSGIGLAIAKGLANSGADVLIHGRDEDRVNKTVHQLKKLFPAVPITGCVADAAASEGANKIIEACPTADILVNNVGVFEPRNFFEITDDEWERFFQINMMFGVRLSRHYTRSMMEQGWGRVLFNSSVTSGFFEGEMVHYGASKAAVLAVSRGLAETAAGSGVTVNSFIPGPVKSEKTEKYLEEEARKNNMSVEKIEEHFFQGNSLPSLIKRFITPQEVADFVVYLSSEQASAITGAALRVDGGIVRSLI